MEEMAAIDEDRRKEDEWRGRGLETRLKDSEVGRNKGE